MARGFGAVTAAKADINERKNSGGGGVRFLFLEPGGSAIVRFLEEGDEVNCAWVHAVPVAGRKVPFKVPCRDQDDEGRRNLGVDCPGCEKDYDLKFRGVINLIWRDAPISEKDGDRWVTVGHEDTVAVWDQGINVFEELQEKDIVYKGLTSRDFRIKRKGSGFDTTYSIEPADPDGGPQPMSEADKELAEDKFNLDEFVVPQSYESWGVRATSEKKEEVTPLKDSPFRKRANVDHE